MYVAASRREADRTCKALDRACKGSGQGTENGEIDSRIARGWTKTHIFPLSANQTCTALLSLGKRQEGAPLLLGCTLQVLLDPGVDGREGEIHVSRALLHAERTEIMRLVATLDDDTSHDAQ
eukprot:1328395-Rhodomonas_salina.2